MDSFAFMGYTKAIELPKKPTSHEIYTTVINTFSPAFEMENWRLLFRQGMGKGSSGILRICPQSSESLSLINLNQ